MDKVQQNGVSSNGYEAPKLVEIGQIGAVLHGSDMGPQFDGGISMFGTRTLGLTTFP